MATMQQFGGDKPQAPSFDLELGLHGESTYEQRALTAYLVEQGISIAMVVTALEEDGDAAATRLASVLTAARNQIDAAVFLLVAGESE
jgi:hypothetical protein